MGQRIIKVLTSPGYACQAIMHKLSPFIKDELYLKIVYWLTMGKRLNLKNPKSYNEKLQWLKIHDIHPEYTKLVDKLAVKEYITEKLGADYVFPTIGVWNHFDEIDFSELPDQFVLKCTHDSGGLVICKDKSSLDKDKARKRIESCLKKNYYFATREYPYKDVPHRIIAEPLMTDESGTELKDYKFFCFNGKCKMLYMVTDRPFNTRLDFFDCDFNHLPVKHRYPLASKEIKKPDKFEEMIRISEKLSEGIPHVRVDLYNINGKIYFGEMTFFSSSGNVPFEPYEWDERIGEWLQLPHLD